MTDYIAGNPSLSLASQLVTFDDLLERLLDVYGVDRSTRNVRNAIRAALEIHNEFPGKREWNHLKARLVVTTVPAINTGTAAYDHTGGAAERLVTLSTAIVPADVDYYTFRLNNVDYEIERWVSSTTFTLNERTNPGADVAASAYTLYREGYPLPLDFKNCGELLDSAGHWALSYSDGDGQNWYGKTWGLGQPQFYTFRSLARRMGVMGIFFGPIPNAARSYSGIYQRKMRPLNVLKYDTGTVSVSDASRSVTLVGGVLTAKHVGCVIRFGTAQAVPTPLAGSLSDGEPFLMERVIDSVESATTFTLDTAADQAFSAVKFTISAPVDVPAGEIENYFYRLCEARLARIEGKDDRDEREAAARRAYDDACAANNMSRGMRTVYCPLTLADIASSVTP